MVYFIVRVSAIILVKTEMFAAKLSVNLIAMAKLQHW